MVWGTVGGVSVFQARLLCEQKRSTAGHGGCCVCAQTRWLSQTLAVFVTAICDFQYT